jgi:hypothetical protein
VIESYQDLLLGAVDIHCHCYPEIALDWRMPLEDISTLQMAREYGMKGIVLKSHMWPTMGKVHHLNRIVEGIKVFGGITLNQCCGGVSPWVAEAACRLGAKVIWMPTWGARNDIQRGGFINVLKRAYGDIFDLKLEDGIQLLEEDGSLKENVKTIVEIARKYDVMISTGHVSPQESLEIAKYARDINFKKLVMAHPNSILIGASNDQMKEMVRLGGAVEFCFIGTMPLRQRFHPKQIVEFIRELGPENCVVSTDAFNEWSPPEPEMLRMFLAALIELGISREDVKLMVQNNPSRLLNA